MSAWTTTIRAGLFILFIVVLALLNLEIDHESIEHFAEVREGPADDVGPAFFASL